MPEMWAVVMVNMATESEEIGMPDEGRLDRSSWQEDAMPERHDVRVDLVHGRYR
jgi:hypothetical protein